MRLGILALLLVCGLAPAAVSDSSVAQPAQTAQKSAEDDDIWDIIKDTTDTSVLQSFLEGFPNSRHAAAARARLAAVTAAKPPAATTAPTPPPATAPNPPVATTTPAAPPAAHNVPSPLTPPRLTRSFPEPRQGQDGPGNMRVDWCLNWGTDCGKPAAEAFCQARGFRQAMSFQSQQTGGPTWVAGDQKICLQPACTALAAVTCEGEADRRPVAIVEEIPDPTINHLPIATCLHPFRDCGKPTADGFCRAIGFTHASGFFEVPGSGTVVHFGDGANCLGCRALKGVICSRGG